MDANPKLESPGPTGHLNERQASERLLKREGLAAALDVAVRTIDEMVAAKEIPVVRIRGAVRFDFRDVVETLTEDAVISKRGCAHRLAVERESLEVRQ